MYWKFWCFPIWFKGTSVTLFALASKTKSIETTNTNHFYCNRYFDVFFFSITEFIDSQVFTVLLKLFLSAMAVSLMDIDWQHSTIPEWTHTFACRCAFNRLCSFHRKHSHTHRTYVLPSNLIVKTHQRRRRRRKKSI